MDAREDTSQALRRVIDAFNRRDRAAARQLLDPEVIWTPTPEFFESETRGRDATLIWFGEAFDADWDEIRLDVSEYRHRDERAIALGRLSGTAKRTRLALSAERAWAATFRQGQLARMRIHEDWSTAVEWLNSRETSAGNNERSAGER
jgi:ketosteroid isomerase-like protein